MPAVDRICLAGYPCGSLGTQKQRHCGDVVRFAVAANRIAGELCLHPVAGEDLGKLLRTCLRLKGGKGNAVARSAEASGLPGDATDETSRAGLRGAVGRQSGLTD